MLRNPANYVPYNGKPCKNGHVSPRNKSGGCVACADLRSKIRYANPDEIKKNYLRNIAYSKKTPWYFLFISAADRARERNISYSLTAKWARERWTGKCEITNISFDLSKKKRANVFSPSIDRINPRIGYTRENCRFILHGLNMFKGVSSDEDIYKIAKAFVKYVEKENKGNN